MDWLLKLLLKYNSECFHLCKWKNNCSKYISIIGKFVIFFYISIIEKIGNFFTCYNEFEQKNTIYKEK